MQQKHTNRLAHETSPYLLQHAHNPVDWYPWGEEAIERARAENKPIFLSVGYSTCYWCHVMERQSFENEEIAGEMNRRFVNVKVDREERPDVDQLYMTAVQVLTRHGGWPMSVFLSPDLKPFYGGTYFPPTDAHGRPGFMTLLKAIDGAYQERPEDVRKTGEQLEGVLRQLAEPQPPADAVTIDRDFVSQLIWRSASDYDSTHGGFGHAPKFPRETLLELMLVHLRDEGSAAESQISNTKSPIPDVKSQISNPESRISDLKSKRPDQRLELRRMLLHTLDAMADGGIRDHLGGGFHRYSTDAEWLVPHFEIMLYDNAMLAWVYAEAYRQTKETRYAGVARGILDFVLREMTSKDGAFFTAFDAEVDAQEGLSYLWTKVEAERVLADAGSSGEDAALLLKVYGLDRGPNFADPHHGTGRPDKNILFLPRPLEMVAKELNTSVEALQARLAPMREALYRVRLQRKQPLLDTKIITSWNALTIRALSFAGRVLDEPRYSGAAARAADHLLAQHRTPDGGLWRTTRDGRARYRAFLDDYAFFAQSLLELDAGEGADLRREQASLVADEMVKRFGDEVHGGFFFSEAGAPDILVRQKIGTDSPLPSGNGVAALVMQELDREESSRRTLIAFAGHLDGQGEGMSALVEAALMFVKEHGAVTAPGERSEAAAVERPPTPGQAAADVVSIRTAWVDAGELHLRLDIASGYHINANEASTGLIATHLTLSPEAQATVAAVEYPPGTETSLAFNEAPVRVYDGTATIVVRFREPMHGKPAPRMALHYQACTHEACLPALTKTFEVPTP